MIPSTGFKENFLKISGTEPSPGRISQKAHGGHQGSRRGLVRGLTRSLPLTRPFGLTVCVVRFPATSLPRSRFTQIFESGNQELGNGPQGVLWMLKLARLPLSLAATPRSFIFYLGNPFPRLKLARLPLSLAATLTALPSISEIPFLDSCVPVRRGTDSPWRAFLIKSVAATDAKRRPGFQICESS